MRGLDPARTSGPGAMMPGHDVAVKAEPGHQQKSPAGGVSQVGPEHLPSGYVPGQCGGIAPQSKILSCQVLGSGRQHGDRYPGLLVDQRRDRSIAAHGHQAAAPRRDSASATSIFRSTGVQATSVSKPSFASSPTRRRTRRLLPPVPELRLATIPTQGLPTATGRFTGRPLTCPLRLGSNSPSENPAAMSPGSDGSILLPDPCSCNTESLKTILMKKRGSSRKVSENNAC